MFRLLMAALFVLPAGLHAQFTPVVKNMQMTAVVGNVLSVKLVSNSGPMLFEFDTVDEYNNGIVLEEDVVTEVEVESSIDWKMELYAESPNFMQGVGASGNLPVGNIGYYIIETGDHVDGRELIIPALNNSTVKAVTVNKRLAINVNLPGHNAGGGNDNRFRFRWQVGTQNGDMLNTSILEQMEAGAFTIGEYNVTVYLEVSAAD